ncbi:60s ribosomal protein l7, partial [Mycena olivaceomarginata]
MAHPPQRVARSFTRFGCPPAITKPLRRNWRTRLPIPHVPLVGREFAPCRLEDHYHASLADNAMYMTYIHEAGPRPEQRKIRLTYDPSNPYARFRHNPPNVVRLEKIVLHSFQKTAIGSRASLLGLIMALRTLSGETERAMGRHNVTGVQLVRGKKSVGGWIRPGVPVGAKVELQGVPMYDFLGQLVEFVLPRLKYFPGILLPPPGASSHSPSAVSGVVSIGLTPQAMQYFPQIEVNVDAYPKMYGPSILVKRALRVCVEF